MDNKFFDGSSKSVLQAYSEIKSAMTARYLSGGARPKGMARSFRAEASSAATHNVVGVGIDEKYVEGVPTGVAAVKFLVRTKLQKSSLSGKAMIPATVDGLPTDVEEVGLIVPFAKTARVASKKAADVPNPQTKMRPAKPGSSVGFREPDNEFIMAGTFGALVKDAQGNKYVLSNNHVLAYESGIQPDGTRREGIPAGASIYQPGLLDGGKVNTDEIAKLTRWVDLRADRNDNAVDAAIAKLVSAGMATNEILFIGAPTGSKPAEKDMIVHKFGRTTSYRAGRISSVLFDLSVPYEVGNVVFVDQIAVRGLNGKRFSDSGDSGSAVLERASNKIVGLLFAGSTGSNLTFCNHIADVLTQLRVKLA